MPRYGENNNKAVDNNPKTQIDKNHQTSSQKFIELVFAYFLLIWFLLCGSLVQQNALDDFFSSCLEYALLSHHRWVIRLYHKIPEKYMRLILLDVF